MRGCASGVLVCKAWQLRHWLSLKPCSLLQFVKDPKSNEVVGLFGVFDGK